MKSAKLFAVVWVTTPDAGTARKLAKAALNARLAACVNIIPALESHYRWKGRIEKTRENLVQFKTRRSNLDALESLVHKLHPYETPEFLVLPALGGSKPYLDWLASNS